METIEFHYHLGIVKLSSEKNYAPYGQDEQNADLDVLPELKMSNDESSTISTIDVEVEKIISESQVAFITGTQDIESGWDSYLDSLNKAGLSDLLSTYQAAYDRMQSK